MSFLSTFVRVIDQEVTEGHRKDLMAAAASYCHVNGCKLPEHHGGAHELGDVTPARMLLEVVAAGYRSFRARQPLPTIEPLARRPSVLRRLDAERRNGHAWAARPTIRSDGGSSDDGPAGADDDVILPRLLRAVARMVVRAVPFQFRQLLLPYLVTRRALVAGFSRVVAHARRCSRWRR